MHMYVWSAGPGHPPTDGWPTSLDELDQIADQYKQYTAENYETWQSKPHLTLKSFCVTTNVNSSLPLTIIWNSQFSWNSCSLYNKNLQLTFHFLEFPIIHDIREVLLIIIRNSWVTKFTLKSKPQVTSMVPDCCGEINRILTIVSITLLYSKSSRIFGEVST